MSLPISRKKPVLLGDTDALFSKSNFPRPFVFDEQVVQVFDDMIDRSVPLYRETMHSIIEWIYLHYEEGGLIYDVGCSTGTLILTLLQSLPFPVRVVGVDNSQPMIDQARKKVQLHQGTSQVDLICGDAMQLAFELCSTVILNYTLQFLPVNKRLPMLRKIFEALQPGGLLIISDKLRCTDPHFHETTTTIYENFKRRAGYSNSEIERKKEALDQVLIPFTMEEELELFRQAGFQSVEPMIRWHNWCTFVAMKTPE